MKDAKGLDVNLHHAATSINIRDQSKVDFITLVLGHAQDLGLDVSFANSLSSSDLRDVRMFGELIMVISRYESDSARQGAHIKQKCWDAHCQHSRQRLKFVLSQREAKAFLPPEP